MRGELYKSCQRKGNDSNDEFVINCHELICIYG